MRLFGMKRLSTLIFLIIVNAAFAQHSKFILISNPEISDLRSTALLDSISSLIERRGDINFLVISGNLTQDGSNKQFQVLKKSLDKLPVEYFLLPGINDLRDANGWELFKEISDNKFVYNNNGFMFIGLSPAVPFTKLQHFTLEDMNWLSSVLDTTNVGKDYYFLSPSLLDEDVDNWKQLFSLFYKKTPELIINGIADKPLLRNLNGYYLFNATASTISKDKVTNYFEFDISPDTISILDNNGKVIASIDKTITIEKDSIDTTNTQTFNADVSMQTDLSNTMLTSTTEWNNNIYTSDVSGLISCIDSTGKVLWDYDANGDIYSKPVLADRVLTAATLQGDIITLSAISGEQIQSIGFEETITSDLSVINYEGSRELMIPKLSNSKSAVVFGTASGKVYCYDLETLQEYWVNKDAKGMIRSKPVLVNNKILYSSRDGFLYCIDARDGLLIWRWKEKADTDLSDSQIFCDGKKVFVVSTDGIMYAINLLLGKLEWKLDKFNLLTNFGMSDDGKLLYLESKEKSLYIVQTDKGRKVKEVKLDNAFSESLDFPIDAGEKILYTNKGIVYTLNKKYNSDKILFAGDAPAHPIIKLSDNKFLISNIDGRIIIFSLR